MQAAHSSQLNVAAPKESIGLRCLEWNSEWQPVKHSSQSHVPYTHPSIAPHQHDVLLGRGNSVQYHPGNVHFRDIVRMHKVNYVLAPRDDKETFAGVIVDAIQSLVPPGRFLRRNAQTKEWEEIPNKLAIKKTRQALREGAPELSEKLTNMAKTIFAQGKTPTKAGEETPSVCDGNRCFAGACDSEPCPNSNVPGMP